MLVLIRRWPSVSLCLHVHLVLRSISLYQNWTHTHTHTRTHIHAAAYSQVAIRVPVSARAPVRGCSVEGAAAVREQGGSRSGSRGDSRAGVCVYEFVFTLAADCICTLWIWPGPSIYMYEIPQPRSMGHAAILNQLDALAIMEIKHRLPCGTHHQSGLLFFKFKWGVSNTACLPVVRHFLS